MIAGILIGCYVAGLVITARIYVMTCDDNEDARLNGTILGLIWPLALILGAVFGLLALPTLGVKTKRERRTEARRRLETAERERDKAQQRIAELEREAGIRP